MTSMNNAIRRLPAEWETHDAVLLSWPHADTDWNYILDEVTSCYIRIVEAILAESNLVIVCPDPQIPQRLLSHLPQDRITYLKIPTNDTWARDFGPLTVIEDNGSQRCLHFRFNGWGLKFASNHDNRITAEISNVGVLKGSYENHQGFVLEGGSIESDGKGTILTTSECLLSPNRNSQLTKDQIEEQLKNYFGAIRVLWLDHGFLSGDDTDSHIDTLARLAPNDTIVYVGSPADHSDIHYEALTAMQQQLSEFRTTIGTPYRLIRLPFPDPVYDENGERLPATYANYLVIGKTVLVPTYSQPINDAEALNAISSAFPEFIIRGVECSPLIKQHGSLHCVTMQLNPR